jgi:hypothetical protein
MRVNRDALMKVVRNTVSQRIRLNRSLMAIYLCGSLLGDDYLLGGAADIDLVFIHTDAVAEEREIVPLTDDVHLDIAHHLYRDYRQTRSLRVHPWLGPTIFSCHVLYDPQHFMDFTQASVRGQFYRSDRVLERAHKQADQARQIWLSYSTDLPEAGPQEVAAYLRAVEHAANAIGGLNGPPLTERRFLLNFSSRAEAVGRPGLYPGLLGLLGAPNIEPDSLSKWLAAWQEAYDAVPADQAPARLNQIRKPYYQKALESLMASGQPHSSLLLLLRTWTLAVSELPPGSPALDNWRVAFQQLGLIGAGFEERVKALDSYLDTVEETLDRWAQANGA